MSNTPTSISQASESLRTYPADTAADGDRVVMKTQHYGPLTSETYVSRDPAALSAVFERFKKHGFNSSELTAVLKKGLCVMTKRQRLIEDIASRLAIGLRQRVFYLDKLGLAIEQLADSDEFTDRVDCFRWDRLARDTMRRVFEKCDQCKEVQ